VNHESTKVPKEGVRPSLVPLAAFVVLALQRVSSGGDIHIYRLR
jgi:hypothetical protein